MQRASDFLLTIRMLLKLHEQALSSLQTNYHLTQIEIKIISFLHNNPCHDTIGDIAELRVLPKGNVSQGVESLVQKNFLLRTPDKADRRKVHLSLTEHAVTLVTEIEKANAVYAGHIYDGFTEEEFCLFQQFNKRIRKNAEKWIERK